MTKEIDYKELDATLQAAPVRAGKAKKQPAPSELENPAKAGPSGRFALMAPYWLDGMHNVEGLALEGELNALLQAAGWEKDATAMAKWMKENKNAVMYELAVVPVEQLGADEHRREDRARPGKLLGGELVRDKEGIYRPQAGGKAVLEDKGESLSIKNKSEQAYKAMIELAKAKGWTAIELSGNKAMLADAWLEAKMQNVEVVNYTPTKEDQQRLVDRLAKASLESPKLKQTEGIEARQGAPAMYSGQILRIEGDKVVQKVGRDPGQVVYHDISKLSRVPAIGEVADIRFGKDGTGRVAERGAGVQIG